MKKNVSLLHINYFIAKEELFCLAFSCFALIRERAKARSDEEKESFEHHD